MIIFVPKYKLSTVALSQAMKIEFKNLKSRARARAGTYLRAIFSLLALFIHHRKLIDVGIKFHRGQWEN